jgi:hypothetical protein
MTYNDLLKKIEGQCNQYRRLYYFLTNCDTIITKWPTIDQEHLHLLLKEGNVEKIKSYLYSLEPLKDWPIRRLREYARVLMITNYSRLMREDLLLEINREESRINRLYSSDSSKVQ